MDSITAIGFIAAFCTTVSFVPQAIKTIKTKQTKDLSLGMYSLFTFGILLWSIYGILLLNFPLIISNVITLGLTMTTLFLKVKYK